MPTISHRTIQYSGWSVGNEPNAYFLTKHRDMQIFMLNTITH